jgi:membrane protein CcdC involved in cytochrome C biogenesis
MKSATAPLLIAAIAILVFFRLRSRLRPAPVRPDRAFIYVGFILLATALSLLGAYRLLLTPLGAGLIPVMLVIGAVLGIFLTRTMTFYRGPDGNLWMKGGALFIGIFVGLIAVRLAVRYAASGGSFAQNSGVAEPVTILNILSADLLFLSVGLWGARAYELRRHRRTFLTTGAAGVEPAARPK